MAADYHFVCDVLEPLDVRRMIHFIMHDLSSLIELKTCQLNLWSSILLAALVVAASQVTYNVHFHPLARYPGPKLAAASLWWQIWIEVVTGQSLSLKLVELHGKYGAYCRQTPFAPTPEPLSSAQATSLELAPMRYESV